MSSTLENNSLKRLATSFGLVAAVVAFMVMLAVAFSPSSVSADTAAQAGNVDANAHAAVCGRHAWRCVKDHRVRAKRDVAFLKSAAEFLWWSLVTTLVVFRPGVGIDRAVSRLMNIPPFENNRITPVERRRRRP